MTNEPDPITLEILQNSLRSITDETYIALTKAAYSTNIKERRDHSTALTDTHGRLVVQAENSLPIHLASMLGMMDQLLAKYRPEDMSEGDIFVANDPYVAGGTHLPDVNLAMPCFVDGQLLGFLCNIAHHADIGGMTPGSMAGGMSEIYQEGLRIPLVRLFTAGELNQDIFDLLLLNVRVPHERRGDYFAQVAACRLGSRRLNELALRYGAETHTAAFAAIMDRTENRLRSGITQIPDGTYEFTDVLDNDGMGTEDIPISVSINVLGEDIFFDFEGTGPQMKGNFNLTFNATQSAVYYVLKAMLDPDLPNNHGLIRAVNITAPPGTLVNANHPAAVAGRANTTQRVVDVLIGALASALPEQAVGAANGANVTAVFYGHDPRHDRPYVYLETLGGGFGGRFTKDGKDGVQVHITNTSNLPVEAIEVEYPLLVESYCLIEDSGGAGKFRGGMGIRRIVRPVGHNSVFSGMGERFVHQPWGIFGGKSGATGRFSLRGPSRNDETLPDKPYHVPFSPDHAIVIETPGAGGYGPPTERDKAPLAADYRSGKFSGAYMAEHYDFNPDQK